MNGDYEPVAAPATKTEAVSDEQVAETRKQHPLSDGALRSIVANEFGVNDPGLCAELAAELLSRRSFDSANGVEAVTEVVLKRWLELVELIIEGPEPDEALGLLHDALLAALQAQYRGE